MDEYSPLCGSGQLFIPNPNWPPEPPSPQTAPCTSPANCLGTNPLNHRDSLASIRYVDCHLIVQEQFINSLWQCLPGQTHYGCLTYNTYVEDEGHQRNKEAKYVCDRMLTYIEWACGDACVYQETPGRFVPPRPLLEHTETLSP